MYMQVFGSKLWHGELPSGTEVNLEGAIKPGIVHEKGLILFGKIRIFSYMPRFFLYVNESMKECEET